jgi:hypothetical protein
MNNDDFYQIVRKHMIDWLLAYKDSSTALWAITDAIKQYEKSLDSRNVLENIKTLDQDPHTF